MANYTAADVKRLRELTGSGMMDCKKALEQSDGDFEKAVELLRIKGAKDVGKRAERATSNGLVVAADGAMVELDCETDFVAKNADFQALADQILQVALDQKPADLEALRAAKLGEGTVEDAVQALSARIGEKLELKRYVAIDGPVALYLHRRSTDLPPAIGVLVAYDGAAGNDQAADTARGVAMQVAAPARATPPATRCPRRCSTTSAASPRRPPARRASPSRCWPGSSRAGSTASSRTSCCSSSPRSRIRRRPSRPCSTRPE